MAERKTTNSPKENISEEIDNRTIPVRKETRDRVRRLKAGKTYEEIISEWADRYGREVVANRHTEL